MITVYAVSLSLGFVGLLVAIFGSALAENMDRPSLDVFRSLGPRSQLVVGAITGFGMGGMAAEFSPMGFGKGLSFLIAVVAGVVAFFWVRYATAQARNR